MSKLNIYEYVNGAPEESFPKGARYYDEGCSDASNNKPMNREGSISYKDGYKDQTEYSPMKKNKPFNTENIQTDKHVVLAYSDNGKTYSVDRDTYSIYWQDIDKNKDFINKTFPKESAIDIAEKIKIGYGSDILYVSLCKRVVYKLVLVPVYETSDDPEEIKFQKELTKQSALSKLTDEEKEVLGL